MTARQFLAFQSAKSTSAKFRRYHLLIAVNEWLADQVRHLDTLIERVTLLAREQAAASTGLTAEQGKARQDLVDTLVELCGLGEGWAASVGNERLRTNLIVTPTGLAALGLRIEVVAPALLTGLREAADLGAHRSGLTPEVLDGLAGQIDRLVAATTVRDFRDERKTVTQELSNALVVSSEHRAQLARQRPPDRSKPFGKPCLAPKSSENLSFCGASVGSVMDRVEIPERLASLRRASAGSHLPRSRDQP